MKSRSLTDYLDQKEEDTKDHKETFGGEGYVFNVTLMMIS